jgi:chromosome segregation ATPase
MRYHIIVVDGEAVPRAGRKRGRAVYVEDDDEDADLIDENREEGLPARSRNDVALTHVARAARTTNIGAGFAETSDFVQRAIRLVQASEGVEIELTKMRAEVEAANSARLEAERKLEGMANADEKLKDSEEALAAAQEAIVEAESRTDAAERNTATAKSAKDGAEREVRRLRSERNVALEDKTRLAGKWAVDKARAESAEEDLRLAKNDVERL